MKAPSQAPREVSQLVSYSVVWKRLSVLSHWKPGPPNAMRGREDLLQSPVLPSVLGWGLLAAEEWGLEIVSVDLSLHLCPACVSMTLA